MLIYLCSLIENNDNRQRFTALFYDHHAAMEKVAMKILKDNGEAEDAVQNAFLQIIKHLEKISAIPCEELQFWCISIVKNEALMLLRKRHPTLPLEDWDGFANTVGDITDYGGLVELFKQLPDSYRNILEMKLLLGYSDREIGQHLGLSETAVSTRASRGRSLLRDIVTKEGFHL